MYLRNLQTELLKLAEKWCVISVTGPRQSGKTTLCKTAFPTYKYVNLEDIPTRLEVQKDPSAFLRAFPNGLIIDEAQLIPQLFSYVQVFVDEDQSRRIVLSGSNDFLLMKSITQSLAGRVAVMRLLPLALSELGDTSKISTNELIYKGFFPAIWGNGREVGYVLESYLSTYVERDLRQIVNIKDLELFRKYITLCAVRIGSEFNATALSNELGTSVITAKEWFRILQTSYVCYELQPFFRNIGKRLVKTPKIYFYDVGLACYLLGIQSPEQVATHPLRGNLFENLVVTEMLKSRYNKGKRSNLYFYRDKGQHEVDVLQEYGNELRAYEIKSATAINSDFFSNLKYIKPLLGDALLSTQVLYDGNSDWDQPENGYINFRHWQENNPWEKGE
ncbi:MAG: ATP-binding protein [Salinivirgaceae bacterium]|nr:ATP-binding protein [Salinivirgaceae bacterium]